MRSFEEILDIAADRKGGRSAVLEGMVPPKSAEEIAQIPDDRWLAAMARVAMMSDDWFYDLVEDRRVIRSAPKIRAIQENAVFILDKNFGTRVADWPAEDFVGLLEWMQKNGSRLGGGTGSYLLRSMGKESYIMSKDVVARLVAEGVIDKAPTSKKAKQAVQEAFNAWKAESGFNLSDISRVLAQSIG